MRNWLRYQFYPNEYLSHVYEYYAAHGVSYICTYYHLDIKNSIIDRDVLDAGSYETCGSLSGLKWEKINLLPIYNTDPIQSVAHSGTEEGVGKFDQRTTLNIPSIYGIVPTFNDFIIFDSEPLRESPSSLLTSYQVVNFEKSINSDITFWNLNIKVSHPFKHELDEQTHNTYTFFDYEKKIYNSADVIDMYKLLEINDGININNHFSTNSGVLYNDKLTG